MTVLTHCVCCALKTRKSDNKREGKVYPVPRTTQKRKRKEKEKEKEKEKKEKENRVKQMLKKTTSA